MVKWSLPAKIDLKYIHDFISQDSRFYAKKVTEEILEKSQLLDGFPMKGRVVPEVADLNIREVFVYSYRLIYEIKRETIYIFAVIHGKRDLTNINLDEIR